MAIEYERVNWDTTKYVNPTNMNQMDAGIKAACDGVDENSSAITAINSTLQWKTLATLTNIQPQQNLDLPTEYNEIIFTFYAADACYTYHFTKAIFDAIPNGCFIRGGYYYYNEDNGACFFKKNSNTQISLRTISKNFVAQTTNGIVQYR